jgi:hypothetical protein
MNPSAAVWTQRSVRGGPWRQWADLCLAPLRADPFNQLDSPAAFGIVDTQKHFAVGWGMVDGFVQNKENRCHLGYWENLAVQAQFHLYQSGMALALLDWSCHG